MGQEKQRISERLARVDTEREKLSDQLKELEFAERVLARFREKAVTTKKRRRESTPSHWSACAVAKPKAAASVVITPMGSKLPQAEASPHHPQQPRQVLVNAG